MLKIFIYLVQKRARAEFIISGFPWSSVEDLSLRTIGIWRMPDTHAILDCADGTFGVNILSYSVTQHNFYEFYTHTYKLNGEFTLLAEDDYLVVKTRVKLLVEMLG